MATRKKMVICRDLNGESYRISASKLEFRPSVYGVIIRGNNILLSKQFDGYDFPGGGIELGETLDEALQREVWEETGLTVKRGELVHLQTDFFKPPFNNKYKHTILMYFLCNRIKGIVSTNNFDEHEKKYAEKAEWIPIKNVAKLKFVNPVDSPALIKQAIKRLKK